MRKKKDLVKGDVIYIIERQLGRGGKTPELKEYIIDEINSSSLYFYKNENIKVRIALSSLKGTGPLSHYQAYINKEDYYKKLEEANRRTNAISRICKFVESSKEYSTDEIECIANYIDKTIVK